MAAIGDDQLTGPTPWAGTPVAPEGLFGPPVEVPGDAPAFDRLPGRTGRDPAWHPPG